jgi:hypothetical protein
MERESGTMLYPLLQPVHALGQATDRMERETVVARTSQDAPVLATYRYDGEGPSTIRTSTTLVGSVLFVLGLFSLIFVLVYTSGNAGPYIPLAFNVPISSAMPGQSGGSSVWNLLLAFSVILTITGLIHLFVLMRECWYPVIDGIYGAGANLFRGMIFFFVHPALVFTTAQIVNVQDWSVLVALVFLAVGMAGSLFMFELYNSVFLHRILVYQLAHKRNDGDEARAIHSSALDAEGTWLPYVMAWIMFIPIWIIVWVYAVYSISALATNDFRYWVVISVPLVVCVLTIWKLVLTGARYSRVRGWLQYECGSAVSFEIIDMWFTSMVVPLLYPAIAMFIVSLQP